MAPFKLDFDKAKHSGKMMLDKSILPVDDMLYASFSGVGRNPALDLENLPLFTGFHTSQVVLAGFLNHQQYDHNKPLQLLPGSVRCIPPPGANGWVWSSWAS